jgi:tetratricopeptide (TPR) repeat protein
MVPRSTVLAAATLWLLAVPLAAQTPPADPQTPPAPEPAALTPEKRGDIYMARKMYREAIDVYQESLKGCQDQKKVALPDRPQCAVLWNKLGIAYHQLQQLDTARKHYERALKFNSKYAEAVNNIGTVHYAKKSYRRAVGQYRKALKLAPKSASIYSNLGTAYFARKQYEDAAKAYQEALALDPDVFEHRSTYGVMLQERNVEERAKFHYYLAKVYAQAGVNDRALQYIRRALEEGFKDKKKFLEEPEFEKLRELAEFKELMALEPRVL